MNPIISRVGLASNPFDRLEPLSGFRADVQALRGLAVLLVVLYHAGGIVPAGFIGVDIFFVISGFVVGRLLVSDVAISGNFDWRRFYARRIRRLLPALAAMLTFVILLTPFFAALSIHQVTMETGRAAALFFANIHLMNTDTGYFDVKAELNPLLHTWSLSIEEQFYVLFPLFMTIALWPFVRRFDRIRVLRILVSLIGVSSFVLCLIAGFRNEFWGIVGERFAFFMPLARAWEFTIGVALTLLPILQKEEVKKVRRRALARLTGLIGMSLVVIAAFTLESVTPFPGFVALMPTLGAALIIHSGSLHAASPSVPSRSRNSMNWSRPFQWMGDISYSWYLWHWPIIVFAATIWPDSQWVLWIAAAVSLGPSLLSWRYVEQRFREKRESPGRRRALLAGTIAIAVPLTSVVVFDSVREKALAIPAVATFVDDLAPHQGAFDECGSENFYTGQRLYSCRYGRDGGPTVALIGDSHAQHYLEALIGAARNVGAEVSVAVIPGCPFEWTGFSGEFSARCQIFITRTLRDLEANPPKAVFVSQYTVSYLSGFGGFTSDRVKSFEGNVLRALTRIAQMGSIIVIINDVPTVSGWAPQECSPLGIQFGACRGQLLSQRDLDRRTKAIAVESRIAEQLGATTWDPLPLLCPTGRCSTIDGDDLLWLDYQHLTVKAAERLIPAMTDVFKEILGPWLPRT